MRWKAPGVEPGRDAFRSDRRRSQTLGYRARQCLSSDPKRPVEFGSTMQLGYTPGHSKRHSCRRQQVRWEELAAMRRRFEYSTIAPPRGYPYWQQSAEV